MRCAFRLCVKITLLLTTTLSTAAPLAKHLIRLPAPHFIGVPQEMNAIPIKSAQHHPLAKKNQLTVVSEKSLKNHNALKTNIALSSIHLTGKHDHLLSSNDNKLPSKISIQEAIKLRKVPTRSILRIHDCLLTATLYTGNWHVECMRSGSTNEKSWQKSTWQPTPLARKAVPKSLWSVCSWLNGFGYDELTSTPDLGLDPRLGNISRGKNVFLYYHGYEVSGGSTLITRLGKHCPLHGKSVKRAPKKSKDWLNYLELL